MQGFCRLVRIEDNTKDGVFGVLTLNGEVFCVTLEPPDKENQKNISCIPPGQYKCVRYNSPKYSNTWQVIDVPNRDYILIHSGNTVEHTQGCILLAEKFGKLKGSKRAILNSGNTFKKFMVATKDFEYLHLTITESY